MLAQPHRGRRRRPSPSPTISISAIPRKPRNRWAIWSAAVKGIAAKRARPSPCPVVSGNVSLYNETNGEAILPTPTIAAVGLIPAGERMVTLAGMDGGEAVMLIGTPAEHLGQSLYLRECLGREEGPPPPVDLMTERARGDYVRAAIRSGYVTACHDVSDGGLAVALAEMAMAANLGMEITLQSDTPHAALFGEDQARYICTVKEADARLFQANAEGAGVSCMLIGTVSGSQLLIGDWIDISVDQVRNAHEAWFPGYMEGDGRMAAE